MRTTVTLDPDVAEMISRLMSERGISFKQALNETVRRALAPPPSPYTTPTFPLGTPRMNLDRALAVAEALEGEALVDTWEPRT